MVIYYVESLADIQFCEQNIDRVHLVLVKDLDVFHWAKNRHFSVPVFVEVSTIHEAVFAMNARADGTAMNFFPTEAEMDLICKSDTFKSNINRTSGTILVGILALQGDYEFQKRSLENQIANLAQGINEKVEAVHVSKAEELKEIDAIVMPGGWSNLQSRIYKLKNLDKALRSFRKPILAICAGMILGASTGEHGEGRIPLDLYTGYIKNTNPLDGLINVNRNGKIVQTPVSDAPYLVKSSLPSNSNILAFVEGEEEKVIALEQKNVIASSDHSEWIHKLFLEKVTNHKRLSVQ